MTTLMDLYYEGVIDYLVKTGVMSPTILSYIQYFLEFNQLKIEGNTYRESVRVLAYRHHVSETTIKKGIRIVHTAQGSQKPTLRIADPRMLRPIAATSV